MSMKGRGSAPWSAVVAMMASILLAGAFPAQAQRINDPAAEEGGALEMHRFAMPKQTIGRAIADIGALSGWRILYSVSLPGNAFAAPVVGDYTVPEALALALSHTALTYRLVGPRAAMIVSTADVDDEEAVLLAPITVRGERPASGAGFQGTPDWVYETPESVSVISREAIESNPPRNTGDIFRGVSGTFVADNPQDPGVNVNVRGLQDQTRVNMMIDGARQNFQQSGHDSTAYVYLDPNLVREVEVEKSVTSGVGGAASLGGSVDFRTIRADDLLDPGETYGGMFDVTSGTNAYHISGAASVAARVTDRFSFLAAASHKRLGEYAIGKNGEVVNHNDVAQEAPVFTGLDTWSGLLKAEAKLTDDMDVELSWLGYDGDFSTGTSDFSDTDSLINHTITATHRWNPSSGWLDLETRLWYNHTQNEQHRPARTTYDAFDVDYALDTFGGSIENTSRFEIPFATLSLNYGAEAFRDETDTASVGADPEDDPDGAWFAGPNPIGERDVISGFAGATLEHDDWLTLSGGLRYDYYDLSGVAGIRGRVESDVEVCETRIIFGRPITTCGYPIVDKYFPVDVEKSGGKLLPSAKIAVEPFEGAQVFVGYSEGYRPPTIMETVLGGSHIGGIAAFGPNPGLKPEESQTWEIGANLSFDRLLTENDKLRLKVVGFNRTVDNYIAIGGSVQYDPPDDNDDAPFYQAYVNVDGETKMRGVELEANYDVGFLYAGASFTYMKSDFATQYLNSNGDPTDVGLLYFAPPKMKFAIDAGARFFDQSLTLGGRVTRVGPSEYDGMTATQYELDDYTVFDLYGGYQLTDAARIRFGVNNLTDVAYVPALGAPSYPAPGRTGNLSLKVEF